MATKIKKLKKELNSLDTKYDSAQTVKFKHHNDLVDKINEIVEEIEESIPTAVDESTLVHLAGNENITGIKTFTSESGGIRTNAILEAITDAGVSVEGVILKDSGLSIGSATALKTDIISETTTNTGVTIDSVLLKDGNAVINKVKYNSTVNLPLDVQHLNLIYPYACVKSFKVVVGIAGVSGCDVYFENLGGNSDEQAIAIALLHPEGFYYHYLSHLYVVCEQTLTGGASSAKIGVEDTVTTTLGVELIASAPVTAASGAEYMGETSTVAAGKYLLFTLNPSNNWGTLSAGKWTIYGTVVDYSLLA